MLQFRPAKAFLKAIICLSIACGLPIGLFAENGLYQIGFGAKAKGMGGAAVAYPQDTLSTMANPAGLTDICDRADIGLGYVYHAQEIRFDHPPPSVASIGIINERWPINGNRHIGFLEAGYSHRLTDCITAALLITPQAGGINKVQSSRPRGGTFFEHQNEKVFYVAVTPMIAAEFCNHSFGVGVDFTGAAVNFKNFHKLASGIINGINSHATAHPDHVTNKGWDYGWGVAGRFGWLWHVNPCVSVGASYRTKTFMSRFKKYEGLISPQGRADLPEVLSAGFAWRFVPCAVFAFDFGRIFTGRCPAFANKVADIHIDSFFPFSAHVTNPHGANNGAAFAWKSRNFYKVGLSYELCDDIILRVGYNYCKNPLPKTGGADSVFLPSTVENHLTLGGTWSICPCAELSFSWIHGFKHTHHCTFAPLTPPLAESFTMLGRAKSPITSRLDQVELEYSWLF